MNCRLDIIEFEFQLLLVCQNKCQVLIQARTFQQGFMITVYDNVTSGSQDDNDSSCNRSPVLMFGWMIMVSLCFHIMNAASTDSVAPLAFVAFSAWPLCASEPFQTRMVCSDHKGRVDASKAILPVGEGEIRTVQWGRVRGPPDVPVVDGRGANGRGAGGRVVWVVGFVVPALFVVLQASERQHPEWRQCWIGPSMDWNRFWYW